MDTLPEELILKSKPSKQIFLIAASAAFVAIGAWMVVEGQLFGWVGICFFGACGAAFIVQLIRGGGYLRIDSDGIGIGTARKEETKYHWNDIEEFGITKISGNKFVSWNFTQDYDRSKLARKVNLKMGAMEAMLPDTYGFKAIELATLLNEYKKNKTRDQIDGTRGAID